VYKKVEIRQVLEAILSRPRDIVASALKFWPRPRVRCALITELGRDYSCSYCVPDSHLPTNNNLRLY